MRIDVEFQSLGATLRGWLYLPTGSGPFPAIAMTHGFSATRTMTIDKYAEEISAAGVAALLYDHRGFGASDGEPRLVTNPFYQAQGYRDALTYLEKLDEVSADRLGLWGDSLSANVVILVASVDDRPKAVVSQIAGCGSTMPPDDADGSKFRAVREAFLTQDLLSIETQEEGPLPVVSSDPIRNPCHLAPLSAFRWFIEHGDRLGSGWVNDATRAAPKLSAPYHAGLCAPFVTAPLLMMISPEDEIAPANPKVSRRVFELLPEPKELIEIAGGHFGLLWHPRDLFDQAAACQIDFLKRVL